MAKGHMSSCDCVAPLLSFPYFYVCVFFPYFYVCVSIVCAALELWKLAFFLFYMSKSPIITFFTCSARSFLRVLRKKTSSGPQCCGEYSSLSPKRNLFCNSYWPLGCLLKIKSKSLWSDCNF